MAITGERQAHSRKEPGAGGFFISNGTRLLKTGKVEFKEAGKTMIVSVPVQDEQVLRIQFDETQMFVSLHNSSSEALSPLDLAFEWDTEKANLTQVTLHRVHFKADGFDYSVAVHGANARTTPQGWTLASDGRFALKLAQRH